MQHTIHREYLNQDGQYATHTITYDTCDVCGAFAGDCDHTSTAPEETAPELLVRMAHEATPEDSTMHQTTKHAIIDTLDTMSANPNAAWVCMGCSAKSRTVHQIEDGEGMWFCAACVERITTERRPRKTIPLIAAALALCLSFATPAAASTPTFDQPVFPTDAYLSGCTITVHVDDGSRFAECPEDGAILFWDADGQRWVNESGAPIRAPGWYVVK